MLLLTYERAQPRPDTVRAGCTLPVGEWTWRHVWFAAKNDAVVRTEIQRLIVDLGVGSRCHESIRCGGRAERSTGASDVGV